MTKKYVLTSLMLGALVLTGLLGASTDVQATGFGFPSPFCLFPFFPGCGSTPAASTPVASAASCGARTFSNSEIYGGAGFLGPDACPSPCIACDGGGWYPDQSSANKLCQVLGYDSATSFTTQYGFFSSPYNNYFKQGNGSNVCALTSGNAGIDTVTCAKTCNITCSSNSDCGASTATGSPFCQGNSVYQNYTNHTCNNPGTSSSACSTSTSAQLVANCTGNQTCTSGNCTQTSVSTFCPSNNIQSNIFISCQKNGQYWPNLCTPTYDISAQVAVATPLTLQYTVSSGHCASVRVHAIVDGQEKAVSPYLGHYGYLPSSTLPKTTNLNLGTVQPGNHTISIQGEVDGVDCSGGNTGLASWAGIAVLTPIINQCSPAPVACNSNPDCGANVLTGSPFCQSGNVYQNYITYTCNNPGTSTSSCTNSTTAQLSQTCTGNQACSNGSCSNTQQNTSVQTNSATNISNAQVTLNGYLSGANNNNSCNTYVWFQWGTNSSYGSETAHQQQNNSGNFSQTISGLSSGNTYHFRAVAQSCNSGIVYGQDMTTSTGSSYTGSLLTINKTVRNLSSGTSGWSNTAYANPSDTLMFMITVQATGNQDVSNVFVRDSFPANLIYRNQLVVSGSNNYSNYSGDITSGINLNTISAGQTVTITYQAQVAPAQNFSYGTTTLNNGVSVTSSGSGYNPTSNASITITRAAVYGASSISTGLTNNLWVDSFFLPLLVALIGIWMWRSGVFFGIEKWLDNKKKIRRGYKAEKELATRITTIKNTERA